MEIVAYLSAKGIKAYEDLAMTRLWGKSIECLDALGKKALEALL